MRGETSLLQAQLGFGPVDSSDDCLHLIPVTQGMHGAQPGDAQEHVGRLSVRWKVEHMSISRAQNTPSEVREFVESPAPGPG